VTNTLRVCKSESTAIWGGKERRGAILFRQSKRRISNRNGLGEERAPRQSVKKKTARDKWRRKGKERGKAGSFGQIVSGKGCLAVSKPPERRKKKEREKIVADSNPSKTFSQQEKKKGEKTASATSEVKGRPYPPGK